MKLEAEEGRAYHTLKLSRNLSVQRRNEASEGLRFSDGLAGIVEARALTTPS